LWKIIGDSRFDLPLIAIHFVLEVLTEK